MNDLNQVAAALDRKDYREAARLLKQLQVDSPQNPWVKFYMGRYYELTDKQEAAEKIYRQLLRDTTHPKVVTGARLGLQRLEATQQQRRQEAIALSRSVPGSSEPAVLILEAVSPENKLAAIQNFSKILNVDPYSARMQLQSRGWRLYKTGAIGELRVYAEELLQAGIPAFSTTLGDIQKIHIFRVQNFQSLSPQPIAICQNALAQLGSLTFNWSEVTARVEGQLPLFMEIMDYAPHRRKEKFRHKEITQDYAQICDLHLPGRNCILRLCEQSYQFQQGVSFANPPVTMPPPAKPLAKLPLGIPRKETPTTGPLSQNTTRINWNHLMTALNQQLAQVTVWSDFTPFAQTALDYTHLLSRIKSHLDLERKAENPWDSAFQLYSGLAFLRVQELNGG